MLSEVADETISSRLINGLVPRKRVRRSLQWVWRGLVSAMQFAVGMKVDGKSDHAVVDAEDAPIAALKARCSGPTRKSCMYAAQTNGEMHGTQRIRSRRCGEESYLGDGAREQSLVHGYWKGSARISLGT